MEIIYKKLKEIKPSERFKAAKKLGITEVPCITADDTVLDIFAGSGTTIIACEQNKRNAFCMEFDPKYCDVIIKRWEKLTGQKAVLLDG